MHNYYRQSGGEDIVFEQERDLLRRAGHEVAEYCRRNDESLRPISLSAISTVKSTVWAGDSYRAIAELLRREKYDIVHVHNTFVRISPSIHWACHQAGVAVVQTLHNYRLLCPCGTFLRDSQTCRECVDGGLWRGIRHACYRGSRPATATVALMLLVHRWRRTWTTCVDRYIALSNFARSQFVAAGLPAERIVVKPNFVYPDPGCRTEARQYAVYLGRLSEEKGLATLLRALKPLRGRVPILIIGDGPMRAGLQSLAESEGLSSVAFLGRLLRPEALALVKGANFLVLPSECYETFGNAIAEAYACGVPVIASDLGSIGEIVDRNRTGLCFRAGDSVDLSEKIDWAWEHPEAMAAMGRAARAKYETNYTADRNYTMLMQTYHAAITARSGAAAAA